MPPAPDVMAALYLEYRRNRRKGQSFQSYLIQIGFVDPSVNVVGMDDRVLARPAAAAGGIDLLSIPRQKVTGKLRVIVLLVDFADRIGTTQPGHYEDLLFSKNKHPSGSMRDFYAEASHQHVEVTGSVHGWLRMPQTYAYYVNGESGTGDDSYPKNCKKLAEDATKAAIAAGVPFPGELDKLGQGFVTALFIVHAGRGAESQQTVAAQKKEIWSHKWTVEQPVDVGGGMAVTTYLVVPHNCKVGVCAHELGHLAFQWQDFYDPNYDDDGQQWDGSGSWDLMAGGSHNHGGTRPAHPAALHKLQHGWVAVQTVKKSASIVLRPWSVAAGSKVCLVTSPAYSAGQYLLLENRRQQGFDSHLPGAGLLVWKVDEGKEMFAPATPGMQLIQADGLQNLGEGGDYNEGDAGDPFPGSEGVDKVSEADTSFPGKRSGVRLSNIQIDAKGVITLTVTIAATAKAPASVAAKKAARPTKKAGGLRATPSGPSTPGKAVSPIVKLPLKRGRGPKSSASSLRS